MTMCFDPLIPLLEKHSKEIIKDVLKNLAEMYWLSSTFFIIEKNVNNSMFIVCAIHTVEYYAAFQNNMENSDIY